MAPPRHVLITGGSRGIGLSIAQLFAKNNYRCTLLSRSEEALKAAIATLQPLSPSPSSPTDTKPESPDQLDRFHKSNGDCPSPSPHYTHTYIPSSLTSPTLFLRSTPPSSDSITSYLPIPRLSSQNDHSRIDVLVNCAGITQASLFQSMTDADILGIIDTNLSSLMVGTKFFLRQGYFRGAKSARNRKNSEGEGEENSSPVIINIASLLALQSGFGAVAYAASKAGVLGFTRALATEFVSHGVRVNAIVPGYVETDMIKGTSAPFTSSTQLLAKLINTSQRSPHHTNPATNPPGPFG